MPLVVQELLILPEHWVHLRFLVGFMLLDLYFYVHGLKIVVCPFVLFLLAIVLSVLRYTDSDYPFGIFTLLIQENVWFMVYNAPFNNISVISWRSVLLMEETWLPCENSWPVESHWQTLSHNVVSSTSCHEWGSNSQL